MEGIARFASELAALVVRLVDDHPLAIGALVGLGGGLLLAWLVRRRHQREQPTGGEADVQRLISRGEVERAADLLVERHQLSRALPLYEKIGANAKLARAYLTAKQPARIIGR